MSRGYSRGPGEAQYPTSWLGLVGAWGPGMQSRYMSLFDLSGGGNNGALANGAFWSSGRFGQSIELDGDDDHVFIGSIASGNRLMLNGSAATFMAWVYHDGFGDAFQRIIDKSDGGGGQNGYSWYLGGQNGSTRGFGLQIDLSTGNFNTGLTNLYNTGEWFHAAVTFDSSGDNTLFYLNGVEQTTVNTPSVVKAVPSATADLRLGTWNHSTARELDGRLDDVRIYSRRLSLSEIKQSYEIPYTPFVKRRRIYFVPVVVGDGITANSLALTGVGR